ncbi:MAG: FAD-binding protein [Clostridia bacterium]|nr:FAD-binding protein [Clostridia bacterium]
MIRINELKLPLDYTDDMLKKAAAKAINIDMSKIKNIKLVKRSVDARHKDSIMFTASVETELSIDENSVLRRSRSNKISKAERYVYRFPEGRVFSQPPVIVGAGPAGLFAALVLAQAGHCPILIERGKSVDERTNDTEMYWSSGVLNTESNVQFGEGGAGAFSDGKLNTGTKDPRCRKVLEEFVLHGAPEEILWKAKPHIGTDNLKPTVKSIRNDIISLGGQVLFSTKLIDINVKNGKAVGAVVEHDGVSRVISTEHIILAIGHSARDTFDMLYDRGFAMEAKPFSVGVRIEHLQEQVNRSQYGAFFDHPRLGAADYKLNVHLMSGRGVYTFCMCPGGYVVASASEEGTIVTNGMSEFARNGKNANSALLVGVSPSDYGSESPLAGIDFQRKIERAAFAAGGAGGKAPCTRVGDFLNRKKSSSFGSVLPTYRPGVEFALPDDYLPGYVCESLREGIAILEKRLHGFSDPDALLTGAETRSSSPVRILRSDNLSSLNVEGVFPCGEGAGYAGGIVSAAADGIRCAEGLIMNYSKRHKS